MERPLAGLQVLDFSRLLPGPYCTSLLAGLGAEVTKIEDTRGGDLMRALPPLVDGQGAVFRFLNAGKRSVALDLKRAEGQVAVQRLARRVDVVVEGFRPGVAERLGIDFATLSAENQRLVYCSISGYPREGPHRDLTGHDLTYAAMSGLAHALSPARPMVPGVQLVDAASALVAAFRIAAALQARAQGPQYLPLSLYEASTFLMPGTVAEVHVPSQDGNSLMTMLAGGPRNDLYHCVDGGWLAVSPIEEPFWQTLLTVLRQEGLIDVGRAPSSEDLHRVFALRPRDEWFRLLSAAGVPCAPVLTPQEVYGPETTQISDSVPRLGEHTVAALQEAGYEDAEIDCLVQSGVARV